MRNQGVILTVGVSLVIFGIILLYITGVYLPNEKNILEQKYQEDYRPINVLTVSENSEIYSDTLITEDLFKQGTITLKEVPIKFLQLDPSGGFTVYTENDKGSILNKRTLRRLSKGEFILKNALEGYEELTEEQKQQKDAQEFKRRAEYILSNNIAGELRTGSLVDIIVDYQNGDYDVVLSKIKIERIIDTSENAQTQTSAEGQEMPVNPSTGTLIILSLDETQYRDMELAKKLGSLRARLYNDESQVASLETFKYAEMKNVVTNIAINKSLTGKIENYGDSQYIGFLGDKTDIAEKLRARLYYVKEQEALKQLQLELKANESKQKKTQESNNNHTNAPVIGESGENN